MTEPATQSQFFHVLQVRGALSLEVKTGMRFSRKGSVLKLAQRMGYTTARTKEAALADLDALVEKMKQEKEEYVLQGNIVAAQVEEEEPDGEEEDGPA